VKTRIKKPVITRSQENPIGTYLAILDRTMDELEKSCGAKSKTGIFYINVNNLSRHEKHKIKTKFNEIRKNLRHLNKYFCLKKQKDETRQFISSHLTSLWEMVCELKSKRLSNYGAVDGSLKEVLDPAVEKITTLLNETQDILRR